MSDSTISAWIAAFITVMITLIVIGAIWWHPLAEVAGGLFAMLAVFITIYAWLVRR